MTIKKYLQGLEAANLKPVESEGISFVDAMQESTEIWNSDACKGYFIRAAQIAGVDRECIQKVLSTYREAFEDLSVDEAANLYVKY